MSGRRGILGGLAALGIGRGAGIGVGAPAGAQVAMPRPGSTLGGVGLNVAMQEVGSAPVDRGLMRMFHDRVNAGWARRNRVEARLALTGGVPPGIGACRSWRPWFAAQATERWRAENLEDPREFERAAWRAVFGREMD